MQDTIRIILDNHSAYTSKETRRFLDTMPKDRFKFVFTPKHGFWLNMIESFFSKMTIYIFFFMQTDRLGIERTVANHMLRTYRAFLEGFSLLGIHNSFGNPISIDGSFDISLNVLLKGIEEYENCEIQIK